MAISISVEELRIQCYCGQVSYESADIDYYKCYECKREYRIVFKIDALECIEQKKGK
jgi:hypothetical protein